MPDRGVADRLRWYTRRLRSMEKGEVFWRAGQVLHTLRPVGSAPLDIDAPPGTDTWTYALERFRSATSRPLLLDRGRAAFIAQRQPELVAALIEEADRSVELSFSFFGYPTVSLPQPIDWHYDPIADQHWPEIPAHRIDHRIAQGNVKWIWELNRLQHLPLLAEAWLFTGDDRYSKAAFHHLDTWIDQNPPGHGIAWRGAFEAGLRSVSIAIALQGLRDSPDLTVDRYRNTVAVLAESAHRCWQERSLFSSANNHLIGEMAGLATVAMMIPELRAAAAWERNAITTLTTEVDRLILRDGCGAEQSVGYQVATVELFQLVATLLQQRDGKAPQAITDAVARSSRFLGALIEAGAPDPQYGDNDHEFALRLGPEHVRTIHEHLGIVSAAGLADVDPDLTANTMSAQWFRQCATRAAPNAGASARVAAVPRDLFAENGGLVVLRHGGHRTMMDVGPLGHLSIAAHGHADALAVTLADGGQDVIGDPGTGSYYQHPRWRTVMRGTRAHATVCVDGEDQSVIGGPFLWSRHAKVRIHGVDLSAGVVDAEHDGYSRLPGRVIHRRWLVAPRSERCKLVVDLVTGAGKHEVRTSWPLHPVIQAQPTPQGHTLDGGGTGFLLLHAATAPITIEDFHGDETSDLGWWSDRLERRVPAWWLGAVCDAELPLVIATLIAPVDGVLTTDLRTHLSGRAIDVSWSQGGDSRRVSVHTDRSAFVTVDGSPDN